MAVTHYSLSCVLTVGMSQLVRSNAMQGLVTHLNVPSHLARSSKDVEVVSDDDQASPSSSSSSSAGLSVVLPHDSSSVGYNGSYYVITINNFKNNDAALSGLGEVLEARLNVKAAVWSYEQGETGTPHVQGYIQLKSKCKWPALRNKIKPIGGWCAPAKGTAQENIDYIAHTGKHEDKPGLIKGPWYFGDLKMSGPGSRSDIDGLVSDIKKGHSLKKLAEDHTGTMLKYFNNAQKISQLLNKKTRSFMTELYIYTGVAGSGKSHAAYHEAVQYLKDAGLEEEPYYLMVPSNKNAPLWWQDYIGQAVVIIDDFYGSIDIDFFKRLIDKYPCTVNCKNGHAEFLARRVYITSNLGWRNWWGADLLANKENEAAIERRITVNKVFTERYVEAQKAVGQMLTDDEFYNEFRCRDDDLPIPEFESRAPTPDVDYSFFN